MTKEELIELSDLNREDNVKYISSEAQGIAIALDSDIYSPTLCKLERAYICGRRKSENRIADLETENKELKEENNYLSEQIQKLKIELDTPESVVLDKLDEAKEIIKLLLGDLRNRSYEPVKDLEQAEQFLKENK